MIISTQDLLILIGCALASGVGMAALGVLLEFVLRKKHPAPLPEAPARPAAQPPAAQVPSAPPLAAAPPAVEIAQPRAALPPVAPSEEAMAAPPPEAAPPPLRPRLRRSCPKQLLPRHPWPPLPRRPLPLKRPRPRCPAFAWGCARPATVSWAGCGRWLALARKAEEIYEGLEEALIGADVGVEASTKLVEAVRTKLKNNATADGIREALKEEITAMLTKVERQPADSGDAPLVIMLVGVNGVGKTTTVAKLAAQLKQERGPVIVAAADTFRAAAIEQLEIWCQRVGAEMIKQKAGSDPAAVAFDAVKAAKARKVPTVLIDTAGRLQTKVNLMEELKKIARVIGRELPGAPHETWLVLDAEYWAKRAEPGQDLCRRRAA